jgi:hypothetical protein
LHERQSAGCRGSRPGQPGTCSRRQTVTVARKFPPPRRRRPSHTDDACRRQRDISDSRVNLVRTGYSYHDRKDVPWRTGVLAMAWWSTPPCEERTG